MLYVPPTTEFALCLAMARQKFGMSPNLWDPGRRPRGLTGGPSYNFM